MCFLYCQVFLIQCMSDVSLAKPKGEPITSQDTKLTPFQRTKRVMIANIAPLSEPVTVLRHAEYKMCLFKNILISQKYMKKCNTDDMPGSNLEKLFSVLRMMKGCK